MSTRSTIIFKDEKHKNYIYVHFDGYPSIRLVEIQEFLKWNGPRNHDVYYTTANFVLWYKLQSIKSITDNSHYGEKNYTLDDILRIRKTDEHVHRGIGIRPCTSDDSEYEYTVDLDAKTILVIGGESDVTVAFGQVVEFDDTRNIIVPQIPAN